MNEFIQKKTFNIERNDEDRDTAKDKERKMAKNRTPLIKRCRFWFRGIARIIYCILFLFYGYVFKHRTLFIVIIIILHLNVADNEKAFFAKKKYMAFKLVQGFTRFFLLWHNIDLFSLKNPNVKYRYWSRRYGIEGKEETQY